jgi:nicotinate-nucleotide adenylyltransferase
MHPLIAYFGGSFDPIHHGAFSHRTLFNSSFALKKLYFLPAYLSPLKSHSLDSTHRIAMLNLAIINESKLAIDTRELLRPPPSYTIDTLKTLRLEYGA